MGMFTEAAYEAEAQRLEDVLRKAINTRNEEIILFTKENIFPLYESALADAWSLKHEKTYLEMKKMYSGY